MNSTANSNVRPDIWMRWLLRDPRVLRRTMDCFPLWQQHQQQLTQMRHCYVRQLIPNIPIQKVSNQVICERSSRNNQRAWMKYKCISLNWRITKTTNQLTRCRHPDFMLRHLVSAAWPRRVKIPINCWSSKFQWLTFQFPNWLHLMTKKVQKDNMKCFTTNVHTQVT